MLVRTDSENYDAIAEALREKTGDDMEYTPAQMAEAIRNLNASGGDSGDYLADQIAMDYSQITLYGPSATFISYGAFSYWGRITAASFPYVENVYSGAFAECYNLSFVSLPRARWIARDAFYGCPLVSVYLPAYDASAEMVDFSYLSTLERVDMRALRATVFDMFASCYNLSSIRLDACTYIDNGTFFGCSALTSISLPECTYVGSWAFQECLGLSEITLPECSFVGSGAFEACASLLVADLPKCTIIQSEAFENCYSLHSLSLPVCTSIEGNAFYNCESLTYLNLPAVTSPYLYGANYLVSVNLPACTIIGSWAFSQCFDLKSISVPNCVTITDGVFYLCYSLETLVLPKVTSLGYIGPYDCPNLRSVYAPLLSTASDYLFDDCYMLETVDFQACSIVGDCAFQNCPSLHSVNLPSCISIGEGAFESCIALGQIDLPQCTSIGDYAFYACTSLSVVSIPRCQSFEGGAFNLCSSLERLYITGVASVTVINGPSYNNVFYGTPFTKYNRGSIYVPSSLYSEFVIASGWSMVSDRIVSYTASADGVDSTTLVLNGAAYYVGGNTLIINAPDAGVLDTTLALSQAGVGMSVNGSTLVMQGANVSGSTLVMGSGSVSDGTLVS